jgi:hypothetical protein
VTRPSLTANDRSSPIGIARLSHEPRSCSIRRGWFCGHEQVLAKVDGEARKIIAAFAVLPKDHSRELWLEGGRAAFELFAEPGRHLDHALESQLDDQDWERVKKLLH